MPQKRIVYSSGSGCTTYLNAFWSYALRRGTRHCLFAHPESQLLGYLLQLKYFIAGNSGCFAGVYVPNSPVLYFSWGAAGFDFCLEPCAGFTGCCWKLARLRAGLSEVPMHTACWLRPENQSVNLARGHLRHAPARHCLQNSLLSMCLILQGAC